VRRECAVIRYVLEVFSKQADDLSDQHTVRGSHRGGQRAVLALREVLKWCMQVEREHSVNRTIPQDQTVELFTSERLEGYGMRHGAWCAVARPRTVEEIRAVFAQARAQGQTVGLRGAGCSYGDAALNEGQMLLDCTAMNRVLAWDPYHGIITVEPGLTIAQLWQQTLADGWWPAVVPGTMAVTIGGAAATNIHGKNNWRDGCFGDHVLAFDLLLPSGELITCSRAQHPDLFYAAIGSFGLLGCFISLTLQLRRIYSGLVHVHQTLHNSLSELMAALETAAQAGMPREEEADSPIIMNGTMTMHLVGWLDTSARGKRLGRGLLKVMHELAPGEDRLPTQTLDPSRQPPPSRIAGVLPTTWIPLLARPIATPVGIRLANQIQWWHGHLPGASRSHDERYVPANFMLNFIPNFKQVYRPGGLMQQQTFIACTAAPAVFRAILERSQQVGIEPALAVLKKHRESLFLLNYLPNGYSLALDFAVGRRREQAVEALVQELNQYAAQRGGSFFLAKDSTLTPGQFAQTISPVALRQFSRLKAQYDPGELLQTDIYRRVLRPALVRADPHRTS
jgi:decaprenylphospho-beta-D-ribofuranose 2-oxidase